MSKINHKSNIKLCKIIYYNFVHVNAYYLFNNKIIYDVDMTFLLTNKYYI